jgi:ATP-dependent Clp protease ATP-binding subunit ClpB
VIQQNVDNELTKGILIGEFEEKDTILVDTEIIILANNGHLPQQKLVFRRVEADSESAIKDSMESFQQILGRHFNFFSYIFHMPSLHKFRE